MLMCLDILSNRLYVFNDQEHHDLLLATLPAAESALEVLIDNSIQSPLPRQPPPVTSFEFILNRFYFFLSSSLFFSDLKIYVSEVF